MAHTRRAAAWYVVALCCGPMLMPAHASTMSGAQASRASPVQGCEVPILLADFILRPEEPAPDTAPKRPQRQTRPATRPDATKPIERDRKPAVAADKAAGAKHQAEDASASPSVRPAACDELLLRASLGEELSDADRDMLRQQCK